MLSGAIDGFTAQGYDYIGMDHFALHDDALARAKAEDRLFRNFQGYTTRAGGDLVGLGVSAIVVGAGGLPFTVASPDDVEMLAATCSLEAP